MLSQAIASCNVLVSTQQYTIVPGFTIASIYGLVGTSSYVQSCTYCCLNHPSNKSSSHHSSLALVIPRFSHPLHQSFLALVILLISQPLHQSSLASVIPHISHLLQHSSLAQDVPCFTYNLHQSFLASIIPCITHSSHQSFLASLINRSSHPSHRSIPAMSHSWLPVHTLSHLLTPLRPI